MNPRYFAKQELAAYVLRLADADADREHIVGVLESSGWRIERPKGAAAALGLNPATLYGRMK